MPSLKTPSNASGYNHLFCRANRAASTRFPAPSFAIASDREIRTVPSGSPSSTASTVPVRPLAVSRRTCRSRSPGSPTSS